MNYKTKLGTTGLALIAGLYISGCGKEPVAEKQYGAVVGGVKIQISETNQNLKNRTDDSRFFADQIRQDMQVLNDLQNRTILDAYKTRSSLENSLKQIEGGKK